MINIFIKIAEAISNVELTFLNRLRLGGFGEEALENIVNGILENINLQDKYGNTALIYSVKYHKINFVKTLLSLKARTDIVNKEGKSAHDYLDKNNYYYKAIKKMLDEFGPKNNKNPINKQKKKEVYIESKLEEVKTIIIYNTKKSIEKKKEELKYKIEVEMKENSKAINKAIELGDLKENADYIEGKRREEILFAEIKKLEKELKETQPFDKSNISTEAVSPGCDVGLKETGKNSVITLSLLGPWDINVNKNIISYLSPIAKKIIGKKLNNTVILNLTNSEKEYKIITITVSKNIK